MGTVNATGATAPSQRKRSAALTGAAHRNGQGTERSVLRRRASRPDSGMCASNPEHASA